MIKSRPSDPKRATRSRSVDFPSLALLLSLWFSVLSDVTAFLALGTFVASFLYQSHTVRKKLHIFLLYVIALWLGVLLSGMSSGWPGFNMTVVLVLSTCALGALSIRGIPPRFKEQGLAAVIAGTVYSVATFAEATGLSKTDNSLAYFSKDGSIAGTRYGAFSLDPNLSSAVILLSLAMVTVIHVRGELVGKGKVFIPYSVISIVAIYLSTSRLAFVLTGLILLYYSANKIRREWLPAVLIFVVAVGSVLLPGLIGRLPAFSKLSGTDVGVLRSDSLRLFLWSTGIESIPQFLPFGAGWGRSSLIASSTVGFPITLHSTWLSASVDLGLLGVLLFPVAVTVACMKAIKPLKGGGLLLSAIFVSINSIVSFNYFLGPFLIFLVFASIASSALLSERNSGTLMASPSVNHRHSPGSRSSLC